MCRNKLLKFDTRWGWEMGQQLRSTLPENQSLVPSTHVRQFTPNSTSRGSQHFWPPQASALTCTDSHADTHIIKIVKIDIKSRLLYMLLLDSSLLTKPLHLGLSLRTKEHVCYGMKIVRHKVCVLQRGGARGWQPKTTLSQSISCSSNPCCNCIG